MGYQIPDFFEFFRVGINKMAQLRKSPQILGLKTFASCLPGLEPLLCGELTRLGASPQLLPGGALFDADPEVLLHIDCWAWRLVTFEKLF